MKREIVTGILFAAAVVLILFPDSSLMAQERSGDSPRVSPNAAVSQTIGTTVVEVTYGRPGMRDREIFGGLVPFGQVWRTGADESTAITFSEPVRFGGERVDAGTYSLYTVPGEREWTIILNRTLSWGTRYDESADLLRVNATPERAPAMEQFMIYFRNVESDRAEMVLHWNETRVPVRISSGNR